jgi:hypothetical protein
LKRVGLVVGVPSVLYAGYSIFSNNKPNLISTDIGETGASAPSADSTAIVLDKNIIEFNNPFNRDSLEVARQIIGSPKLNDTIY